MVWLVVVLERVGKGFKVEEHACALDGRSIIEGEVGRRKDEGMVVVWSVIENRADSAGGSMVLYTSENYEIMYVCKDGGN